MTDIRKTTSISVMDIPRAIYSGPTSIPGDPEERLFFPGDLGFGIVASRSDSDSVLKVALFSSSGCGVTVTDSDPERVETAIWEQLETFDEVIEILSGSDVSETSRSNFDPVL